MASIRNTTDLAKVTEQAGETFGELIQWDSVKKGHTVAGIVEDIRNTTTDLGDATVMDIRADDEELYSIFLPYNLLYEVERRNVQPGDLAYIQYDGDEDIGGGKSMRKFLTAFARDGKQLPLTRRSSPGTIQPASNNDDVPF